MASVNAKTKHSLRILNSYTGEKELFKPNSPKTIKWYTCGPTVYDVSHLGHARCYITFDIIRRILIDYFGYNVFYVMNITDIDDKIIKRARCNYLYEQYVAETIKSLENKSIGDTDILLRLKFALKNFSKRLETETDVDKKSLLNQTINKSTETLHQLELKQRSVKDSLEDLKTILSEDLDSHLSSTVSDPVIFKVLTDRYESEFHEDMKALNIIPPNVLTRVSEYVDEIGAYIKVIEDNGFAYRSNGSIYFDTMKFDSDPKHRYAKLVREAFENKINIGDGEGELSTNADAKKSSRDFVLWKRSKDGEPKWKTQDFELGRPGWHIECSMMASHMLGSNLDIHSGGCDLKFPHHDNEIAQAEAHYNTGENWVNFFIHSGHLTITGHKMSKSLKNFITIKQALKEYTARQLRFAFLTHSWPDTLDYSANTMTTATSYEKTFKEFFLNVTSIVPLQMHAFVKWNQDDIDLNEYYLKIVDSVDAALCDNFDTRTCLGHLSTLIKECNKKFDTINIILLTNVAKYVCKMLNIFGTKFDELKLDSQTETSSSGQVNMNILEQLASFRSNVRTICKSKGDHNEMLALCDQLRLQLRSLGVRLEDREMDGKPYVIKLIDPNETAANDEKPVEKKEQADKLNLQKQREEKAKIPPNKMFIDQLDKYSKFNEVGFPTHDADGKELTKSTIKKLTRLFNEQEERYKKFMNK